MQLRMRAAYVALKDFEGTPPEEVVRAFWEAASAWYDAATAEARGGNIDLLHDARAAVEGVDVVVTDTWVSMGQAAAKDKLAAMAKFQVTTDLMARAAPHAVFLHCLPVHRGEEVTAEVIDGPRSAVWDEAENRLHVQKAILLWCLGRIG